MKENILSHLRGWGILYGIIVPVIVAFFGFAWSWYLRARFPKCEAFFRFTPSKGHKEFKLVITARHSGGVRIRSVRLVRRLHRNSILGLFSSKSEELSEEYARSPYLENNFVAQEDSRVILVKSTPEWEALARAGKLCFKVIFSSRQPHLVPVNPEQQPDLILDRPRGIKS